MINQTELTNVMRILTQKKINFTPYYYETEVALSGAAVAEKLNMDPDMVYKTLVTVSASKQYYVFMIPVLKELDLKKAARSVHEKNISMIPMKDLLPLTGYVHGGCSPIGMKKKLKTVIDISASEKDSIVFSAGKIGYQVEIKSSDLCKLVSTSYFDLCSEHH